MSNFTLCSTARCQCPPYIPFAAGMSSGILEACALTCARLRESGTADMCCAGGQPIHPATHNGVPAALLRRVQSPPGGGHRCCGCGSRRRGRIQEAQAGRGSEGHRLPFIMSLLACCFQVSNKQHLYRYCKAGMGCSFQCHSKVDGRMTLDTIEGVCSALMKTTSRCREAVWKCCRWQAAVCNGMPCCGDAGTHWIPHLCQESCLPKGWRRLGPG